MPRFPDPRPKVGDYPTVLKLITNKDDFPQPSEGNVISLEDGVTYVVFGTVDLEGRRLSSSGVVTITGYGPESSWIKSTGLSAESPLLQATNTVALSQISLEHAYILDLDATGQSEAALDWFGVNFRNATGQVGTVANYNNFIGNLIGFLNSGGLTLDGTFGTVGFSDTLFDNASGLTSITFASTLVISRRFRATNCAFVSLSGETAIEYVSGATIPTEGLILNRCNFSGGGTYLTGITYQSNVARWNGNRGIANSANYAQYTMSGNETVTTVSQNVFTKVLGTTSAGEVVEKFNVTDVSNRATYLGSLSGEYKIDAVISFTSGTNNVIAFRVTKNGTTIASSESRSTANGTRNENIVVMAISELQTNDYIEIFVTNTTNSQNVTVTDLNVIVTRLTEA